MIRRTCLLFVFPTLGLASACAQTSTSWTQLSHSTCRVDEFLAGSPNSDGRGVVIAVLDTGVDPSIPGLTQTPDGQVKVIDVQDFTGQGDVELHRVRLDAEGKLINHSDDGDPIAYTLPALPDGGSEERRFWFGFFDEGKFINSSVPDLNMNGSTEDQFPICVTALVGDGDDQAICLVDTNMDRSFADEKPLHNYKISFDTFTLHRDKPEDQIVPVTFAANIFLRQAKVVFHYDDGAHGTHVAGIAAGYRINNQDGFNGIAPGAKIISLKIGQNAVGGVSTSESIKKALEYAGRFAREHGMPVVCNLSYGVESVIDGHSDIDEVMNVFLRKNPYLVFCSSAGNEGPGLSSVGTPSAATEIITVAAMLAADSGRDVQGYVMNDPVITVFSSRGGELDKPDIATPGWSTSTVPRWVTRGDYWAGTSMASPYAAGLCAILISDARAQNPGVDVRACDVRTALTATARPVVGAGALGMGAGMPSLPAAAKLLNQLVASSKTDPILGYDITTRSPHAYKGQSRAAYWRGTYFPSDEPQVFAIRPVFAPTTDASTRTSFTRKFELHSRSPWCKITQKDTYLRSEQSARVGVQYDPAQLTEPGLHVGVVDALADGRTAFQLITSIIIPYRVGPSENFQLMLENQTVKGWSPSRYFFAVPAGASAMKLTLSAPKNQLSKASFERIYDPTGKRYRIRSNKLDTPNGTTEVSWSIVDELMPGVWEVPVVADRPDKEWPFDLGVRFFGLHAEPSSIHEGGMDSPSGDLVVTNLFETPLPAVASGTIEGFRMQEEDEFKGLKDTLSYSMTVNENCNRVRYTVEMTPEAYATTTDIGISIEQDGAEIFSDAFSNRTATGVASVSPGSSIKLIIRGGFAVSDDERATPVTVKFDQLFKEPTSVSVTQGDSSRLSLVPGVPVQLQFKTNKDLPTAPDGQHLVGYISIRERSSNDEALRVGIDIEP